MRLRLILCVALLCLCLCAAAVARAEDQPPSPLHEALVPLRSDAAADPSTRGATPAFATIKHQLRDWIQDQLGEVKGPGDAARLAEQLNDQLREADLGCTEPGDGGRNRCARPQRNWSALGFLGAVQLDLQDDAKRLVIRTRVGIECGYDDSAYVYERRPEGWRARFEIEQTPVEGKPFEPQTLLAVYPSTDLALTLTLGVSPTCGSAPTPVYYRVWRSAAAGAPRLLLDGHDEPAAGRDPPILGSLGPTDALVEYRIASLDPAVTARAAVRHFRIDGDKLERIDPIALSPRDFVEEWLKLNADRRADWADRNARPALTGWSRRVRVAPPRAVFIGATRACETAADGWQVGVRLDADKKTTELYFLVRWRPPYRFRMVDIDTRPWTDCTAEDAEADAARTLFPVQEWR